jgi:predicted PurR-regulated permease PerM
MSWTASNRPASMPFALRLTLVIVAALAAWFLYLTIDLWLVFFASVLAAVIFNTCARLLARGLHLPRKLALVLIFVLAVALIGLGGWAIYDPVSREVEKFLDDWPRLLSQLRRSWIGRQMPLQEEGKLIEVLQSLGAPAANMALAVGSAVSVFVVGLFLAIFLAVDPQSYLSGAIRAVPRAHRESARSFLSQCGRALERWLLGQIVSMAIVGLLTGVTLRLFGLPYPYLLGALGGLFQFVPYLGPMLWVIPAFLLTASVSLNDGILVLLVYGIVQMVEGNLITPLVQRRAVELPPVSTLLGTVMFGLLFGPLALMLATPLLVVMLVAYQRFYLGTVIGETELDIPGSSP